MMQRIFPTSFTVCPHPASWVDKETGETKQEDLKELRFIPACNPVPEGGKTICSFTSEKSKAHQNLYDPDTLNTFNTDVVECFEIPSEHLTGWKRKRQMQDKLRKEVEEVLIKIRNGEIPEYDYEMQVPPEIDVQMKKRSGSKCLQLLLQQNQGRTESTGIQERSCKERHDF